MRSPWPALDISKFLCVAFMVFIHATFWLVSLEDEEMATDNFLYPLIGAVSFIGLFPLCLPLLAGVSLRRYLDGLREAHSDRFEALLVLGKVAVGLVVASYLMNVLSWGWNDPFEWDVLQFLALSFLVLAVLRQAGPFWLLPVAAVGVLALAPWLREQIAARDTFWTKILVGTRSADAYWPFFPWFFTVAFGFCLAELRARLPERRFIVAVSAAGAVLTAGALALGSLSIAINPLNIWGPTVFQPQAPFVLGLCGFGCLLLGFSHWVGQRVELAPFGWVMAFSRGILWIYLTHTVVGVWLSHWVKRHVPLEISAVAFPAALLLFSWAVGSLSQLLATKRVRVVVARTR